MTIPITALDFCSEPVNMHCPVCGVLIFSLGRQTNSCHHLIFTADSADENWIWQQQQSAQKFYSALEEKYIAACKNGFYADFDTYITTIRADVAASIAAEALIQKSAFMISISTSDIGCGGMHNGTIHAIFDYQPAGKLIQPFPSVKGKQSP